MSIAHLNETLKNSFATSIRNALDAGSAGAKINIYTGTMRATPNTALSGQTLLGTLVCSTTCGVVTGAVLTFSAVTQEDSALANGEATWAALTDSDDTPVLDVDITDTAGTGALKMNDTTIAVGGPIVLTTLSIEFG